MRPKTLVGTRSFWRTDRARRGIKAAGKLAPHVRESGHSPTREEAAALLTPEEYADYWAMIAELRTDAQRESPEMQALIAALAPESVQ